MKKYFLIILGVIFLAVNPCYSANKTIDEFTELDARPAENDWFPIWDTSTGITKKIHRRNLAMSEGINVYKPDASQVDQGLDTTDSVKYFVDDIGTSKSATLLFTHSGTGNTTTYTFSTSETIPSNIQCVFEEGAILSVDSGKTLTVNSPEHIIAGHSRQIMSGSGSLAFTNGGTVYSEWWGNNTTPGTTDMTSEIQAAMTSIGSGKVKFLDYIYLVSSALSVPSMIKLRGTGRYYTNNTKGTVIKLADSSDSSILTCSATQYNIIVKGIKFDGNKANQTDTTDVLVDLTNARRVIIDNCYFYNAIGDALKVQLAHITHCFFMTNDRRNVHLVTDNYFASNEVAGGWHSGVSWSDGSVWAGAGANKILNNSIYLCGGSNGLAIYGSVKNIVIGNRINHNYAYGIFMHTADYNIVKGNRLENNSSCGTGSKSGVLVHNADHNIVSENICMDDGTPQQQKYGIEETGTSDYNLFVHNDVSLNQTGGIARVGAHTRIEGNIGADETVTAVAPALQTWGYSYMDSTSNDVAATLADGQYAGQMKTIVLTDATSAANGGTTVTVAHHEDGDAGEYTFKAVDDICVFMWKGTEWYSVHEDLTA